MKIGKKLKTQEVLIAEPMPDQFKAQLKDLSINEAIEKGLITDLGDAKGNFFFEHADDGIEAHYAIINGYAVRMSQALVDDIDNIDAIVGRLRFTFDVSTIAGEGLGKQYFRLGMPRGLKLGASVYALKEDSVEA